MQTVRLFIDVARLGSFSQAAARHGITQSAVSQRIGALERRLGAVLLDRSVRPLGLTEAGQVYLRGCRELLERYDLLEQRIRGLRPQAEGIVRVAAIYSAGIDLLECIREQFESEFPQVSVELTYDQPEGVYLKVLEQRCDLGILSYPQRWRKVEVRHLRDEPMAVACNPRHPLAGRSNVHAHELDGYPMVTFDASLPVGRRIRRYLRQQGAQPQVTSTFDNIDTLKGAVAVTDRFSILPKRTVMRDVKAGVLAVVDLLPPLTRPLGVIHRRGKVGGPFSAAAEAFENYLIEHAGPNVDMVDRIESDRGHLVGARR